MKIHSLTSILAIPFVVIAALIWIYVDHYNPYFIYYFVAPIFCLVALYMSQHLIDYWWLQRNPVPLDEECLNWLNRHDTYYQNLTPEQKSTYEQRLKLYLYAREFQMVGKEQKELPEDLKLPFATAAVRLSMNEEDFLIGEYDRIFVYKHPFPTPKHQYLHTVETDNEDGVLIFSLEQAVSCIMNPQTQYNTILYGYLLAMRDVFKMNYPSGASVASQHIALISGMEEDHIRGLIGLDPIDRDVMVGVLFFTHKDAFQKVLPEEYSKWLSLFPSEG